MQTISKALSIAGIMLVSLSLFAQSNTLRFTTTKVTNEKAIQLHWRSESNAIYRLEYTPALSDSIVWDTLVDLFPSQGTNTIFLDTGKYWIEPELKHPKDDTQRYYRLLQVATNTLTPPIVTITNLTTGTNISGEVAINVSITSTNPITFVHFFVDGEEVELGSADDDGNASYTINTTEWPNGQHVIFVVAETFTGAETTGTPSAAQTGAGTSAVIPVIFDNYISKWYFSLPGFDSSLGETQRITAQFEANSCWTLDIEDEFLTIVRTASGAGSTMSFDWDGTDDFGFDVQNGTYDFILTADTCAGMMAESGAPESEAAVADGGTQWLAMPKDGSGSPVPLLLYPPGADTNGLMIFEGSMADYTPQKKSSSEMSPSEFSESSGEEFGPLAATAPQTTRRPRRPPPKPIKGKPGKLGIAWQGHHPDTTNGIPGFNRPANLIRDVKDVRTFERRSKKLVNELYRYFRKGNVSGPHIWP